MRIDQVHISHHVRFFTKQFCELWNLREYDNVNDAALFFGCYDHREIEIIKAHRGFKLIMLTGEGSSLAFAPEDNVHVLGNPALVVPDKPDFLTIKRMVIPVKDYSAFKPVPLGDKIYCYQGRGTDGCKKKYNYALLQELMHELGKDKFLIGYQGHTMEEMVEQFYKPSFINLQLNPQAGFSSTLEMAHMGRMSMCNIVAPFSHSYTSTLELILKIKLEEATKHFDVTAPLYRATNKFLHYSHDWLNTEYWK